MTVVTINKKMFQIVDENAAEVARMIYNSSDFEHAEIESEGNFLINKKATGVWVTTIKKNNIEKVKSRIKVELAGIISVQLTGKKRKYYFKKSANWKLRFLLANREGEELLCLIPLVNWQKESHDFVLQLNEEFEKECDPFLILQAVHCANCSLSMMTGGKVPALVSI